MLVRPSLTVRAFAELIELPVYEHERILRQQKRPGVPPASYRIPYYRSALAAIRDFYRAGGDASVLDQAVADLQAESVGAKPEKVTRLQNNIRVLQSFARSRQRLRKFTVMPLGRWQASIAGVDLRMTPDLSATEGQLRKYVLYNCRDVQIEPNYARTTLELSHWVLSKAGVSVPLRALEYVDLVNRKVYVTDRARSRALPRAQATAHSIAQIWASI